MAKTPKTNACRLLDRLQIPYRLVAYAGDPTAMTTDELAQAIGHPLAAIFKTLVVKGNKSGLSIAVIPKESEIDLGLLARHLGDKKVELVPSAQLFALTGYVRGGVTALATKRPFPVVLDESARGFDEIGVSAGEKGRELILTPSDYAKATQAQLVVIARTQ